MMTTNEEDALAKKLSELTPMEYSQLMKKVDRDKWKLLGFSWNPRIYENKPDRK